MVHRWMQEDRQRLELIELQRGTYAFLPLQLAHVTVFRPRLDKVRAARIDAAHAGAGVQ